MDHRIIELEKRAAFQDAELADCKDALNALQKEIGALRERVRILEQKSDVGDLVREPEDETLPPHY